MTDLFVKTAEIVLSPLALKNRNQKALLVYCCRTYNVCKYTVTKYKASKNDQMFWSKRINTCVFAEVFKSVKPTKCICTIFTFVYFNSCKEILASIKNLFLRYKLAACSKFSSISYLANISKNRIPKHICLSPFKKNVDSFWLFLCTYVFDNGDSVVISEILRIKWDTANC